MRVTVLLPRAFEKMYNERLRSSFDEEFETRPFFFDDLLDPDQISDLAAESDGIVVTLEPVTEALLERLPRLKVVANFGAGYDNVDLDAARHRGIYVTNAPGANAPSVAEYALAMLLAVARDVPALDRRVRDGEWAPERPGIELSGKTLGIVGLGRIGKRLVELVSGIGMEIIAYDPYPDAEFGRNWDIRFVSLEELAVHSDLISVHAPLTESTRGLLGSAFFAALKPGSRMVNTSRGGVLDEPALITALQSGRLAAVALDVAEVEPLPEDNPLRSAPTAIVTSHIGGSTAEAIENIGAMVREDLHLVSAGKAPAHNVY